MWCHGQKDIVAELDETVAAVIEDCDKAQEDDLDEANQLAALVGFVDDRRAQGEFPLLQPHDLLPDSVVTDDQDTLPLVCNIQTVNIQS